MLLLLQYDFPAILSSENPQTVIGPNVGLHGRLLAGWPGWPGWLAGWLALVQQDNVGIS